MLRKIKPKLSEREYKVLYPSGSSPGKFYGTVKIHKVPKNGNIDQLPIRPIASNLNNYIPTSKTLIKDIITFERIWIHHYKYKTFYGDNKTQGIEGFQMLSFDVKSLFTNVPLETTIDIILRRIYNNHELTTSSTKKQMKELRLLFTKNVHFTCNRQIYIQVIGVAIDSFWLLYQSTHSW